MRLLEEKVLLSGLAQPAEMTTQTDLGVVGASPVSSSGSMTGSDIRQFKFTLSSPGDLNLQFSGLTENINANLVYDINGNDFIDANESIDSRSNFSGTSQFTEALQPGKYLLELTPGSGFQAADTSSYTVTLTNTSNGAQDAGNTLSTATNAGTLSSSVQSFTDISQAQDEDVYQFNLSAPSTVQIGITGLSERVNYRLVQDLNGNNQIESEELLEGLTNIFGSSETTNEPLNAGTYFFIVSPNDNGVNTSYTLTLSANPIVGAQDGGNTMASPTNLGALTTSATTRTDVSQYNEWDVYRFQVSAASTVTTTISGLSERVNYRLVQDLNGNNQIESEELLEGVTTIFGSSETTNESLNAGTYFFIVSPYDTNINTSYTLSMSANPIAGAQDGGNTMASPTNLGALTTSATTRTDVSQYNEWDVYRFQVSTTSTVTATISGLSERVNYRLVQDLNGNNQIESDELLEGVTTIFGSSETTNEALNVGTYVFIVSPYDTNINTSYTLTLSANPIAGAAQDAGNTMAAPANLGTLTSSATTRTDVSQYNEWDVYRFQVSTASNVTTSISGLSERVNYRLVQDLNGNNQIDSDELLEGVTTIFGSSETTNEALNAGTYFFIVSPYDTNINTSYTLTMSANPVSGAQDAGNTLLTARDAGSITSKPKVYYDVEQYGDVDIYQFEVTASATVTATISGLSERVWLRMVQNTNGNNQIDAGEVLQSVTVFNSSYSMPQALSAGNYFFVVSHDSSATNTSYQLTFSSNLPAAPAEIVVTNGATNLVDGQSTVAFGTVVENSAAITKDFTISNIGDEDLILEPATVTSNSGFTITSNFTSGQIVAAGETATLTVRLDSTGVGDKTATLSFANNDANENPFDLTLNGRVRLPNRAPTVTAATVNLAENSAKSTVVTTVAASDPDGDALTYAIVGGNTGTAFVINSSTGVITVDKPSLLNYEGNPNQFSLLVRATDNGDPQLSDEKTITVNLTDVNDPPVVTNNGSKTLAENLPNGATVFNFSTLASDQDINQTLTYAITDGNTNGAFAINTNTGVITVANMAALNFETTPSFELKIKVTDTASAATTVSFFVNLENVNEAPVITNRTDFRVNENSANGGVIYQFNATDPDVGQTKTFTIVSGNTDNAFAINAQTGALTVNNSAALDFETNPIFNLVLKVQDNGTPPLSNTYNVTGYLNDLNEKPEIGGAVANQAVNDNATINPFASLTVTDPNNQNMLAKVTINNGVVRGDFTAASTTGWTRTVTGNNLIYSRFYSPSPNIGSIVQGAIRAFVFQPRSNAIAPGTTEKTAFTVFVNDGVDTATNSVTSVITTSVNSVPIIGGAATNQPVNDDATIAPFSTMTVTDGDSQEALVKVTILNGAVRGDLTVASRAGWTRSALGNNITYTRYFNPGANMGDTVQTALRALVFQPRTNAIKPGLTELTDFQVSVSDGEASAVVNTGTRVVTTSVNNTPTIGGAAANQTVNDNTTVAPFSTVTVTDADTQEALVKVTILNGVVRGDFTAATSTGWTRSTSGNNILYSRYFSAGANMGNTVQTALRALVFQPRSNAIKPGTTEATDFQISVSDGIAPTVLNTGTRVTTTSVNNAPTISGAVASQAMNNNTTKAIFSTLSVTDPDTQEMLAKVTILNGVVRGDFTAASTVGWTRTVTGNNIIYNRFYNAAPNISATVQAAIRAFVFQPRNNVPVGQSETTAFSVFINDGLANVTNSETTVVTTGVAPRTAASSTPLILDRDISTLVLPSTKKSGANSLLRNVGKTV